MKWRLLRARQSLKRKLEEVFNLERRQASLHHKRMRNRVCAALPLLALFQPIRPRWGRIEYLRLWLYRRLLPLAYAALVGLGGSLIYDVQAEQAEQGDRAQIRSGPIQVRLEGRGDIAAKVGEAAVKVFLPCAASKYISN